MRCFLDNLIDFVWFMLRFWISHTLIWRVFRNWLYESTRVRHFTLTVHFGQFLWKFVVWKNCRVVIWRVFQNWLEMPIQKWRKKADLSERATLLWRHTLGCFQENLSIFWLSRSNLTSFSKMIGSSEAGNEERKQIRPPECEFVYFLSLTYSNLTSSSKLIGSPQKRYEERKHSGLALVKLYASTKLCALESHRHIFHIKW